jgi:hypothetical protein
MECEACAGEKAAFAGTGLVQSSKCMPSYPAKERKSSVVLLMASQSQAARPVMGSIVRAIKNNPVLLIDVAFRRVEGRR